MFCWILCKHFCVKDFTMLMLMQLLLLKYANWLTYSKWCTCNAIYVMSRSFLDHPSWCLSVSRFRSKFRSIRSILSISFVLGSFVAAPSFIDSSWSIIVYAFKSLCNNGNLTNVDSEALRWYRKISLQMSGYSYCDDDRRHFTYLSMILPSVRFATLAILLITSNNSRFVESFNH